MALKIIVCAISAYLVGCINPAYIMGKLQGMDIRKEGSGNAGASNALILMGKSVAVFSALFDIMKAAGVMWLAPLIFRDVPFIAELAGVSCTIGHIFPILMKFQGGKGLACLGGILLAIDYRLLLIMLAIEIIIVLLVDYICVIPITASVFVPVLYGVLGDLNKYTQYQAAEAMREAATTPNCRQQCSGCGANRLGGLRTPCPGCKE